MIPPEHAESVSAESMSSAEKVMFEMPTRGWRVPSRLKENQRAKMRSKSKPAPVGHGDEKSLCDWALWGLIEVASVVEAVLLPRTGLWLLSMRCRSRREVTWLGLRGSPAVAGFGSRRAGF